jgi:hypothetical protein
LKSEYLEGPVPTVSSPSRSIRAISTVESMGVGTYHFTRVPSHDMDVYMASLFGGEVR